MTRTAFRRGTLMLALAFATLVAATPLGAAEQNG
jgi:hypothetical protein